MSRRYLKIFFLQFQEVIEDRSRILVYFLLACVAPLVMILFWRGASQIAGWTAEEIASYYLFTIFIYAIVMSHQEEHVATLDIQEGGLTAYLLKPFSYIHLIFLNEISYRLMQGVLGLILLSGYFIFFPKLFTVAKSIEVLLFSVVIVFCAFLLTFVFKMAVSLLAFWLTEMRGAFEAVNVLIVIFSGVLMPLAFLPHWLENIAYLMPFAYMIYFPVISFEGKLAVSELWKVLGMQLFWITIFYLFYKKLWKEGLKQYTSVGQ